MGKSERSDKRDSSTKSQPNTSSSDDDSDNSESSADSAKFIKEMKKLKKKIRKEERRTARRLKKKIKNEKKKSKKSKRSDNVKAEVLLASPKNDMPPNTVTEKSCNIPIGLMERSKTMAPMTKEEWEKKQSVVRKVLDEESGRYRLIKGDGEVLEEIVSWKKHKEINKQATLADGSFFQSQTQSK